jgi:hypothetical protein
MGDNMDRLLVGIVIAVMVLIMNGGLVRDVLAKDAVLPDTAPSISSQAPVGNGLRSETVLSLMLALEALRATPALLDGRKS